VVLAFTYTFYSIYLATTTIVVSSLFGAKGKSESRSMSSRWSRKRSSLQPTNHRKLSTLQVIVALISVVVICFGYLQILYLEDAPVVFSSKNDQLTMTSNHQMVTTMTTTAIGIEGNVHEERGSFQPPQLPPPSSSSTSLVVGNDVATNIIATTNDDNNNNNNNFSNETYTTSSHNWTCYNPAVNMLTVASSSPPPLDQQQPEAEAAAAPRILCFILTHQPNHDTRIRAIWDTWGTKCDKLAVVSDFKDPSINAVNIQVKEGYWNIAGKVEKFLKSLYQKHRHAGLYDWILKADDDTYVIMENLKAFLAQEQSRYFQQHQLQQQLRQQQQQSNNNNNSTLDDQATFQLPPLLYGRIMPWPQIHKFSEWSGWFPHALNQKFGKRFSAKFPNQNQTLEYMHGGPGYILNWPMMDIVWKAYNSPDRLRGKLPEDISLAATLLYHNVTPTSTHDPVTGLERSHPEPPSVMYENPKWLVQEQLNIQRTGTGEACCSTSSVSYHHMTPDDMRSMHFQLYQCPSTSTRSRSSSIHGPIIENETM
jgi:glycoprotein-N-acetylgalactosamine 3-beta-galactosyltransferase